MPNQLKKFEFKEPKTLSPVTKTTTGVVDELESKSIKDTLADKLNQQKDKAALTIQRVFRGMQARTEALKNGRKLLKINLKHWVKMHKKILNELSNTPMNAWMNLALLT